jgi:hypothetical protein
MAGNVKAKSVTTKAIRLFFMDSILAGPEAPDNKIG